MSGYVLAIDQSTQATKAVLFDSQCKKVSQAALSHKQIVNEKGWVEHDLGEILSNTLEAAKQAIENAKIDKSEVLAVGISNQRETIAAWDKTSGKALHNAIVWQCARAQAQCDRIKEHAEKIKLKTGLNLSPYFSAAKMAWLLDNVSCIKEAAKSENLCFGTIDSFLVSHLTEEKNFYTEYSNASRTQLLNINTCTWDEDLCDVFGIPVNALPQVVMSDSIFGHTTLGGFLDKAIPICGVLGDSQAALYGQGCLSKGQVKATYGTGSSVMMQTGESKVVSDCGLVTSIAWGLDGKINYVLEGNLNYTGAVISRMIEWGWIDSPEESERLCLLADKNDNCYLIPAFTGLGAPYFDSSTTGMITGITRITGKNELVKAGVECIAYQIADLVLLMQRQSNIKIDELRVDGGPTANAYLMQFQSDITNVSVAASKLKELSACGVAIIVMKRFGMELSNKAYLKYLPKMPIETAKQKFIGYKNAVAKVLSKDKIGV